MTSEAIVEFLRQINEVVTSATVIVAVSMLLYDLAHGPNDMVARASSVLLGCVSLNYVGDVLVAISRSMGSIDAWLRVGWIGISMAPAALFHLSSALLATTGLISRGRRRRVVRLLYLIGAAFAAGGTVTDLVIHSPVREPIALLRPGPMFALYIVYFVLSAVFAFNNVLRARRRCLTRASHRRMTYLLFALITPIAGIFPYSLLFPGSLQESPVGLLLLINGGNLAIVLMLAFMAYPLAFFGPKKPDRAIKAELLSFMLRGPVTGIAVLIVVMFTPGFVVIGIPGQAFMPFAAVTVVLALQWSFTVVIPFLERRLIYIGEQEQARQLQDLSARLLTDVDAHQLLEATLAAICDYLRVPSAFAASIRPEGVRMEQSVGPLAPLQETLDQPSFLGLVFASNGNRSQAEADRGSADNVKASSDEGESIFVVWQSYWLLPLHSTRSNGHFGRPVGVMGVWARAPVPDLLPEEKRVFRALYKRVARVLDDMKLQEDLFTRLEDVLQETNSSSTVADRIPMRYGNASEIKQFAEAASFIDQPDFADLVRDALRDYWGGPRLTDERITGLRVVQNALPANENNPARAVRAILSAAIDRLKPEGVRSMTLPEWTLFNILDLRFVQGKKVRDAARMLAISDSDLYRKQRIATDRLALEISTLEKDALHDSPAVNNNPPEPATPAPTMSGLVEQPANRGTRSAG